MTHEADPARASAQFQRPKKGVDARIKSAQDDFESIYASITQLCPARKTSPDGPPPLPFPLFADACGGRVPAERGPRGRSKLPSVQPEVGDVARVLF